MEDRYLFKAKTCNGEWVRGFLASNKGKLYISNRDGRPFAFEIRPDTICQCTGLKDKNGKLIWENDILHNGNYFIVKWNVPCARFDIVLNNSHNIPMGEWGPMICDWKTNDFKEYKKAVDYEVIGNIVDNPELLESEENVEKCYCKTTDYLTIRREVIGYGRSLVVGIDFKKKAITTYYSYACDSGTSKNLNIEYCPLCGEKL